VSKKDMNPRSPSLTPGNGKRFSKWPDGVVLDPPAWNLPAEINIPQGSFVDVRLYAANADGYTLNVTGLAAGLTYNAGLERIEAGAEASPASSTATFAIDPSGLNVTATTTVAVTAVADGQNLQFDGNFEAGNLIRWGTTYWGVPVYGRPIRYSADQVHVGDGQLMGLVAKTARTIEIPGVGPVFYPEGPTLPDNQYSVRMMIKNSANGTEPEDCDQSPANTCTRRRTMVQGEGIMASSGCYGPRETWWGSLSIYVPSDFNPAGSGFFIFTGIKPSGWPASGIMGLNLDGPNNTWRFQHFWGEFVYDGNGQPNDAYGLGAGAIPWWQTMYYDLEHPGTGQSWTDIRDFPNAADSRNAFASVTKNSWTHWVWQIHMDGRSSASGGQGFWKVWKKDASHGWVQVLNILPKITTRGGRTFDHGIGYDSPKFHGSNTGMYCAKTRAWDAPNNLTIYMANIKVGKSSASFIDVSPDGSVPV
jgi:hypothetical protein